MSLSYLYRRQDWSLIFHAQVADLCQLPDQRPMFNQGRIMRRMCPFFYTAVSIRASDGSNHNAWFRF